MMSQLGFFDIANRYAGLDAKNDPLVKLDAVVPWEDFRSRLEAAWRKPSKVRKSPAGRKPLDAVMMFKAIVLCSLYNLSDDQVEYQIRDRLSFMRFLGLGLDGKVPDAKTVWLYRDLLTQGGDRHGDRDRGQATVSRLRGSKSNASWRWAASSVSAWAWSNLASTGVASP